MGTLNLDPITTLEQMWNSMYKIPLKSSRNNRIISYINQAVTAIITHNFQNAAENILLIEYEIKSGNQMNSAPVQSFLLKNCHQLRRAFREYYGIFIPQRVNPFKFASRLDYLDQKNCADANEIPSATLPQFAAKPQCENCPFQTGPTAKIGQTALNFNFPFNFAPGITNKRWQNLHRRTAKSGEWVYGAKRSRYYYLN